MPGIARVIIDSVNSLTGAGDGCAYPLTTTTGNIGSTNVLVNGSGVVREGDTVNPHLRAGCDSRPEYLDDSALTTFSSKVFVNGLGVGRVGDEYTSDNIITSGSTNVFGG